MLLANRPPNVVATAAPAAKMTTSYCIYSIYGPPQVRWRINCDVLDTVVTCLEEKIPVGDLPTADDLPVPPLPEGVTMNKKGNLVLPKREDYDTEDGFKAALQAMFTYRRTVNKVRRDGGDGGSGGGGV